MAKNLKIKLPARASRSGSPLTPATQTEPTQTRPVRKKKKPARDPDYAYEFELNVDDVDTAPSPMSTSASKRTSQAGPSSSRKRQRRQVVSSDGNSGSDQDNYEDDFDSHPSEKTAKRGKRDRDQEFLPDSSPSRPRDGRKGVQVPKGKKGRAPAVKGDAIIIAKDERKQKDTIPTTASASPPAMKRPREKAQNDDIEQVAEDAATTSKPEDPPPPKRKKLPTIKKNKSLVGSTIASGPSTPLSTTSVTKIEGASAMTAQTLPANTSSVSRKPAALVGTQDLDLMNASVYNSLFKSVSTSVPKAGLNRKEKEEERRRELQQMRDQARKTRIAELEQGLFDLQAGQEKVSRFEASLRARNSPAVFPHHLAAYLKFKEHRMDKGQPK